MYLKLLVKTKMEQPRNNEQIDALSGMQQGEFSVVDYLNHLAEEWRLQGYSEGEIQQGVLAEQQKIDNTYYELHNENYIEG